MATTRSALNLLRSVADLASNTRVKPSTSSFAPADCSVAWHGQRVRVVPLQHQTRGPFWGMFPACRKAATSSAGASDNPAA